MTKNLIVTLTERHCVKMEKTYSNPTDSVGMNIEYLRFIA